MGNIRKQVVLSTFFSYFGVVAGFLTSAVIMPKYFATDQLGLVKLITACVGLLSSVFSLGVGQLLYRTYSNYKIHPQKQQQLFYFSVKLALLGTLLAIPFYIFFRESLLNYSLPTFEFEKTTFFLLAVFIAIFARILYNAIFGYIRMMGKVVIDAIVQNILHKVGMLLFVLMFVFGWINFSDFIYSQVILFLLFPLVAIFFLFYRKSFPVLSLTRLFDKRENREFYALSFFGSLATIGGSLYIYLDTFMVNIYLGESAVGIYGTMFLFGVIVSIPARNLKNVAVAYVAEAFANNDVKKIQELYQRSSNSMLAVGGFLFLGIIGNMHSVLGFLPEAFSETYWIVFFIGCAQLIDMVTSINIEILASSKHYRLNTYFVFLAIITAVVLNIVFIPVFGIVGAAAGTFMAIFINNIIRCFAIWHYYKFQPFSINTIKIFVLITGVFGIVYLIPDLEGIFSNLIFKGLIITLIYLPTLYFLKASEDINNWINSVFSKFKN